MVFLQHRALKAFQETLRSNSFLKPYAQWMPAAMNENPTDPMNQTEGFRTSIIFE